MHHRFVILGLPMLALFIASGCGSSSAQKQSSDGSLNDAKAGYQDPSNPAYWDRFRQDGQTSTPDSIPSSDGSGSGSGSGSSDGTGGSNGSGGSSGTLSDGGASLADLGLDQLAQAARTKSQACSDAQMRNTLQLIGKLDQIGSQYQQQRQENQLLQLLLTQQVHNDCTTSEKKRLKLDKKKTLTTKQEGQLNSAIASCMKKGLFLFQVIFAQQARALQDKEAADRAKTVFMATFIEQAACGSGSQDPSSYGGGGSNGPISGY